MLIGLLSDTHIPDAVLKLPHQIWEAFRHVDLILHAGDIFVPSVLDELESIAPVLAARGDSEYLETRNDMRVKEKQAFTVEGVTIWLTHDGQGGLDCQDPLPDVFVTGHTHAPIIKNHGRVLLVSPGSPTYPNYKCQLGTVGLLTIRSGEAEAKIIKLA
jgi:putative phosphoesterase